jgi:hypothetical protein
MKIHIDHFKGIIPKIGRRILPDSNADIANNLTRADQGMEPES